MADYDNRHFVKKDGSLDLTTNVEAITNYCLKHGLVLNNKKQTIEGFTLFPSEYFCPKDYETGEITITENTYTIHHFNASWHDKYEKILTEKRREFIKKYGEEIGNEKYRKYYQKRKLKK